MSITVQSQTVIKSKEELDNFTKEYDKNFPLTISRDLTEKETSEYLVKRMVEKLKEMQEYHEKHWKEFETSHIKNYIQKVMHGKIKTSIWKDFFNYIEQNDINS